MSNLTKPILDDSSVVGCQISNSHKPKFDKRQRNGTSINYKDREYGVIDTLQQSYGFITCFNKITGEITDKRLFFHQSEVVVHFSELKIGDYVEFQEHTKNCRPVAVRVERLNMEEDKSFCKENWCLLPIVQQGKIISLNTALLNQKKNRKSIELKDEPLGSITYTNNSEHFFLTFYVSDVPDNVNLKQEDLVNFQISQDIWSGQMKATNIVKVAKANRIQGVISSLKDGYGFIEREDEVKEIYFNFEEYPEPVENIQLGNELDFSVKHLRNGKEEAVNIKVIPKGTVVFFDVFEEVNRGTILRTWDIKRSQSDPFSGRISFTDINGSCIQLPFGERDQLGAYTLHPGDLVTFQIAEDRRDHLQRATNISLCVDSFSKEQDRREKGMIISLRESQGGILPDKSPVDDQPLSEITFKIKEIVDLNDAPLEKYQCVSYTLLKVHRTGSDGKPRETHTAIRITRLPSSSLSSFHNLHLLNGGNPILGAVQQDAISNPVDTTKSSGDDEAVSTPVESIGIIVYQLAESTKKEVVCYSVKDVRSNTSLPKKGDTIEFCILELRESQIRFAIDIKVKELALASPTKKHPRNNTQNKPRSHTIANINTSMTTAQHAKRELSDKHRTQGYIIVLKESFGFIETADHSKDVYFKFSSVRNNEINSSDAPSPSSQLYLGAEVDFILKHCKSIKGAKAVENKIYADDVRLLPKGTLTTPQPIKTSLCGRILKLARQVTADNRGEYHGFIEDDADNHSYRYTVMSQHDLKTFFRVNDPVKFDVVNIDGCERAVNVMHTKLPERARVVGLKDSFGFLDYQVTGQTGEINETANDEQDVGEQARRRISTSSNSNQLFFHTSAIQEPADGRLEIGDLVEFDVTQSAKTGRYSAVNLRRIECSPITPRNATLQFTCQPDLNDQSISEQRPTRLKIKSVCEEASQGRARLIVIRAPKGPDGTKGFTTRREAFSPYSEVIAAAQ